ncbi:MAG TPA: Wzz/FepE/Etk N-terminal domain-containing protein [Terriglobales bacterium]|nr:Wzz/FepE/Etk N-terminal domain-containing protein [Terriglobales bacterium]
MATGTSLPMRYERTITPKPASPESHLGEISFLDVLIALAKRKGLIMKITAAGALFSGVLSFVLPKSYTATVLLLPPQQNSSLGVQLAGQLGSAGGVAALAGGAAEGLLKNPNDMFVSMLKSRTVEDAMVNRYGMMQEYRKKYLSDARRVFERRTTVDGAGKDGLLRISIEDSDPRRAAELANGYVDQFRQLSEHLAITEASQRRLFFEKQMERAKDDLANAETLLTATEEKTGLIQLDSQAKALIESAATLRAQIVAKEVQIQGMETYATGENAQVIEARQELNGLRSQLSRLGGDGDTPSGILPPKGQMTQSGMEYVRRLRDVKYYETIFDILAREFEIAKLDEAREGSLIQVVDTAVPPDKKSFPPRGLMIVGGVFLGLFAGVCWVVILTGLELAHENPEAAMKLQILWNALRIRPHAS